MADALIFDVDGTLWDSRAAVAASWREVCAAQDIPCAHITADRLRSEFGKPMYAIGDSLFPALEKRARDALMDACCDRELTYLAEHPPLPYEGVKEVFAALSARLPLFIVSNCQAGYIEVMLKACALTPFVTDHLCPGDTGKMKSDNIREILARYALTDARYIGDTAGDAAAASEAGVGFIHAAYGFGDVPEAKTHIQDISELLRLPL